MNIIKDMIKPVKNDAEILASVLGVDLNDKRRNAEVVNKRQVVMWKLMKIGYTSHEVGRAMGYSHATVLHGSRKVTDLLSINDPVMVRLTKMVDVL